MKKFKVTVLRNAAELAIALGCALRGARSLWEQTFFVGEARSGRRSTALKQNRRTPVSLRWPGFGGKRLPGHPFTGIATGFASLNVT